jgi:hypothetical protein
MANSPYERFVFTAPVRMVWPNVIEPKPAHTHNGISYKAQYEARFLFGPDHPDLPALRSLLGEIAMKTFGADAQGGFSHIKKFPIEQGDAEADKGRQQTPPVDREFFRGMGRADRSLRGDDRQRHAGPQAHPRALPGRRQLPRVRRRRAPDGQAVLLPGRRGARRDQLRPLRPGRWAPASRRS